LQIYSQIRSQIDSQKLHYFNIGHYGDTSDYGWLAFYDYFEKIGIHHNCPDFTIFKQLIKQTNIFSAIQLRKICIICRPPVFIARDNQNRLHCIEKSAIVFRGGYEQYYVHGVYFDKKLFNKYFIDKTFTMSDILKLSNVEQKAAIIQIIGYEQILNELKPMILDKKQSLSFIDHKPVEYSLFECDCNGFRLRIIQVEDHTSHKKYIHSVPLIGETMSVDGALNWMFPCSNRKYNPDMES